MVRKTLKITLFSILSLIVLFLFVTTCILHGRISTMMSLKYVGDDLYTMNYKQDYHLDKALKKELKTEEDLFNFICSDMLFGYKIDANISKYACSAFMTTTPDEKELVGRNYDFVGSDALALYTNPKGGYSSISTVSLDMLNVGENDKYSTKSLKGRISLLAAPYLAVDGMNEKGLTASLLDMKYRETHMDSGKPDLIVTLAIRLLLDKASTVDEAINLLKQYDIHTAHGWTQHIFIADKNGNSAIVEWFKNELQVVDYNVCTNFRMYQWMEFDEIEGHCDRFDTLNEALKEKPKNTKEEAMNLLKAVKQDNTEWSVVYNLTDLKADYVLNRNYDNVYHLDIKNNSHEGLILTLSMIGIILLIGGTIFLIVFLKKKKSKNTKTEE